MEFWGGCSLCGLANGSFESLKKVIAVDLGCLLGTVFGGFGGFWKVWSVWRVLEGLRPIIAVAWPWGACWGSGLGPGPGVPVGGSGLGPRVHVGEGVWNFGSLGLLQAGNCSFEAHRMSLLWPWPPVGGVAAFAGWQTAALKASRKSLLWIWGACWGRCLEGLAGFGGFGAFGEFWSVCGLANGSFESP